MSEIEIQAPARTENEIRSRIDELLESGIEKGEADDNDQDESPKVEADESPDIEKEIEQAGESPDEDDDADESPGAEDDQDLDILDAKQLAERLNLSIDDVYAMRFNYDDGESMTLGELKDLGSRSKTIDDETERLEADREDLVNEKLRSRDEMQSIIAMMPNVSPQLLNQAREQFNLAVRRERSALMEAIPEWSDTAVEDQARSDILENLAQYGFKESEVKHMLDHRLVKLINDFTRLRNKVRKPLAEISAIKKRGGKRRPAGNRSGAKKHERAKRIANQGKDSRSAINSLFED